MGGTWGVHGVVLPKLTIGGVASENLTLGLWERKIREKNCLKSSVHRIVYDFYLLFPSPINQGCALSLTCA